MCGVLGEHGNRRMGELERREEALHGLPRMSWQVTCAGSMLLTAPARLSSWGMPRLPATEIHVVAHISAFGDYCPAFPEGPMSSFVYENTCCYPRGETTCMAPNQQCACAWLDDDIDA